MLLVDPHGSSLGASVSLKGRSSYLALAWLMRVCMRIWYDGIELSVTRMSLLGGGCLGGQGVGDGAGGADADDQPGAGPPRLLVRWVFEAVPRWQLILGYINPFKVPKVTVYEGVFVYSQHRKMIFPTHEVIVLCNVCAKPILQSGFMNHLDNCRKLHPTNELFQIEAPLDPPPPPGSGAA
ncbi:hypothetical protein HK101_006885 [Irineochytrium annulatum]|nr:hypothetical protein HK101_006885 [Irineochytrium annulatum]